MNTQEVLTLYDYHYWAEARILRAALQLTPEQFVAKNTSSHGSLRGTLVHALSSATVWRRRLQGELPSGFLDEVNFSTPQALYEACRAEEVQLLAYLAGMDDAGLQFVLHYKTTKGVPYQDVVWHLLFQVLNHGTQHRAEAAMMLTDFGHSPGDVDLIVYLREKGL